MRKKGRLVAGCVFSILLYSPAWAQYECFAFDPVFISSDRRQPEKVMQARSEKPHRIGTTTDAENVLYFGAGKAGAEMLIERENETTPPLLAFPDALDLGSDEAKALSSILRDMSLTDGLKDEQGQLRIYELHAQALRHAGDSLIAQAMAWIRFYESTKEPEKARCKFFEMCKRMAQDSTKAEAARRCLVTNAQRIEKFGMPLTAALFYEETAKAFSSPTPESAQFWLLAAEKYQMHLGDCFASNVCGRNALAVTEKPSEAVLAACYVVDYYGAAGHLREPMNAILREALKKVQPGSSEAEFLQKRLSSTSQPTRM